MNNLLLDTDVLMDFFLDRKPFSDDAAKILSLCELKQLNGFVTPVIISNLYYLLRKLSNHNKVIEKLKQLLTFIDVLEMTREIIIKALNSDFKDFEDALQNYSAENSMFINVIITRNTKDYKNSYLGVMTPEDFLKLIAS
ncbi:MAG: PIN domain-containing protein [Candidatus Kapabacteria bacterium]|nr:PIN domain-containing protein [Candidatus Kapabacteria bacterium]